MPVDPNAAGQPGDSRTEDLAGLPLNPPSPSAPLTAVAIAVREHLVRFGYLDPLAEGPAPLAKALWGFQRLHRLPLTGVPDVVTLGTMHQQRCGNSDLEVPVPLPRLWSVGELVCEVANAPRTLTLREAREAFAEAIRCWQPHLPFKLSLGRGGSEATVVVRYVAGDHGDGCPVGGDTGVLGHAFMLTGRGARLIGEIHLDTQARWGAMPDETPGSLDLVAALVHQLGHIFGLGHAMIPATVMHPILRWGRRDPARQDLATLRSLQQARQSVWQRLRDRLRLG